MLGGTEFVGRALTDDAVRRGWDVTVFHRGRHEAPPGVAVLHGDRRAEGGLAALAQGEWDVVVDTWSAEPTAVRDTARLLAGRAGTYAYVSSGSVYRHPVPAGAGEEAPVVEGSPDAGAVAYAEDKRGGELAVTDAFGDRGLLVRAGLILGPWENIGRLPYWLERMARGGTVPAPGPRDLPLQFIDVRDLAAWTLDAAARGLGGPFNVTSRPGHTTTEQFLEACARVTGGGARLHWVTPEDVRAAAVEPWTDLPVWLPPGELHDNLFGRQVEKAHAEGLRCRPVEETVADTWAWLRTLDGPAPRRDDRPRVGLSPEQEAALLRAAGAGVPGPA
ncbi:reductase [Streptomyces mashuensis]|uniref:Reductase n=2 Tax=Streptomyces mashuensis TaxID=33904 RepID=A0A919B6N4_9ACTN|nr:reductase [Streptomyces mashuensis]